MTEPAAPADSVAASNSHHDSPVDTPPPPSDPEARRQVIGADLAHTVLEATARRLAEAIAAFDDALDRRAPLYELQFLDRETAAATRAHDLARRRHRGVPGVDPSTSDDPRPDR